MRVVNSIHLDKEMTVFPRSLSVFSPAITSADSTFSKSNQQRTASAFDAAKTTMIVSTLLTRKDAKSPFQVTTALRASRKLKPPISHGLTFHSTTDITGFPFIICYIFDFFVAYHPTSWFPRASPYTHAYPALFFLFSFDVSPP